MNHQKWGVVVGLFVVIVLAITLPAAGTETNSGSGCPDVPTTVEEKTACILLNVEALTQKQLPDTLYPEMDSTWPGQTVCVSCYFFCGLVLSAVEVGVVWAIYCAVVPRQVGAEDRAVAVAVLSGEGKRQARSLGMVGRVLHVSVQGFAVFGFVYWLCLFGFWWNFISWMVLMGPMVVLPAGICAWRSKNWSWRFIWMTGCLFGVLTVACFSSVERMPEQVVRHVRLSEYTFTPNAPLVQQLKDKFYGELPRSTFEALPFKQQMEAVDKFIYREVQWRSDQVQWGMVGLITTPTEVLSRPGGPAGDCQGQSATTASLLQALGFSAWQVETPFHWWTHARSRYGEQYNLNSHGNAMGYGSVLPQPIDMVYTSWPPQCTDCPYYEAHNKENVLYEAPPHLAFALAFVGSGHMVVREMIPSITIGKVVVLSAILGLLFSVGASYRLFDLGFELREIQRLVKRFAFSAGMAALTIALLVFWGVWLYQVCVIQAVALLTLNFYIVNSPRFNAWITNSADIPVVVV